MNGNSDLEKEKNNSNLEKKKNNSDSDISNISIHEARYNIIRYTVTKIYHLLRQ